jgi:hypothetical protein
MMGYGKGDEALVRYALHEYADGAPLEAFERLMQERARLLEMVLESRDSITDMLETAREVRTRGRHEAR